MRTVAVYCTLWVVLAVPFASGQDIALPVPAIPEPRRDGDAMAVIQNAIGALGGEATMRTMQDCVVKGTITGEPNRGITDGEFTWELAGNEFRYDNPGPLGRNIYVSGHGEPAVSIGPTVTKLSPHVARANFPLHLPAAELISRTTNPKGTVFVEAVVTVGDRSAYKIRLSLVADITAVGVPAELWFIDQKTFLPLRVEYLVPSNQPGEYTQAAAEFSDYRVVSGQLVPFQIRTYFDSQPEALLQFQSVTFNSGVSSSDFDLYGAEK